MALFFLCSSIIPYSPYRQVPQHRESLSSIPTIPTSFSPEAQPFIPTGPTSPGALKGWTSPEATYAEAGGLALAFGESMPLENVFDASKLTTVRSFALEILQAQVSRSSQLGWDPRALQV